MSKEVAGILRRGLQKHHRSKSPSISPRRGSPSEKHYSRRELERMTVRDIKAIARDLGIPSYSRYSRNNVHDLIQRILWSQPKLKKGKKSPPRSTRGLSPKSRARAYNRQTMKELKKMAVALNIPGVSRFKTGDKSNLVKKIIDAERGQEFLVKHVVPVHKAPSAKLHKKILFEQEEAGPFLHPGLFEEKHLRPPTAKEYKMEEEEEEESWLSGKPFTFRAEIFEGLESEEEPEEKVEELDISELGSKEIITHKIPHLADTVVVKPARSVVPALPRTAGRVLPLRKPVIQQVSEELIEYHPEAAPVYSPVALIKPPSAAPLPQPIEFMSGAVYSPESKLPLHVPPPQPLLIEYPPNLTYREAEGKAVRQLSKEIETKTDIKLSPEDRVDVQKLVQQGSSAENIISTVEKKHAPTMKETQLLTTGIILELAKQKFHAHHVHQDVVDEVEGWVREGLSQKEVLENFKKRYVAFLLSHKPFDKYSHSLQEMLTVLVEVFDQPQLIQVMGTLEHLLGEVSQDEQAFLSARFKELQTSLSKETFQEAQALDTLTEILNTQQWLDSVHSENDPALWGELDKRLLSVQRKLIRVNSSVWVAQDLQDMINVVLYDMRKLPVPAALPEQVLDSIVLAEEDHHEHAVPQVHEEEEEEEEPLDII